MNVRQVFVLLSVFFSVTCQANNGTQPDEDFYILIGMFSGIVIVGVVLVMVVLCVKFFISFYGQTYMAEITAGKEQDKITFHVDMDEPDIPPVVNKVEIKPVVIDSPVKPKKEVDIVKKLVKLDLSEIKNIKQIFKGDYYTLWNGVWKGEKKVMIKDFEVFSQNTFNAFFKHIKMFYSVHNEKIVGILGYSGLPHVAVVSERINDYGPLVALLVNNTKKLTFPQKVVILLDVAEALQAYHMQGYIHGDLCPDNIFVDESGRAILYQSLPVKITKKRLRNSVYSAPELVRPPSKRSGSMVGEKKHMEFFKCDIFSFGIVMYVLAAETLNPYGDAEKEQGIGDKVARNELMRPDISGIRKNYKIAQWFTDLMEECWSRRPVNRPEIGYIISCFRKALS